MIKPWAILICYIILASISCESKEVNDKSLEIATDYYALLNHYHEADSISIIDLIADSIIIRESEDDYQEVFTAKKYEDWFLWDQVFEPVYEILEIKKVNETVVTKLRKSDVRLDLLHEGPMEWKEVIHLKNQKIFKVEREKYYQFNVKKFLSNREKFTTWLYTNHENFEGFLFDQTKSGGSKYLHAIELYQNRESF